MDIIEDAQRIMRSYGDIPASELIRKILEGYNMDEMREQIMKPELKEIAILTKALVGSVIFYDGSWWKIVLLNVEFEDTLVLRELTNAEMVEVLNSRKLVIAPEKERLSKGNKLHE